jgi:hypothetical protein
MTRRPRIVSFGLAGALVLAGAACAAFVEGLAGQLLTIALLLAGLAGAVFLLFLEVGLAEEAERAREQERRSARAGDGGDQGRSRLGRRRPG